jgi:hypothetical protein
MPAVFSTIGLVLNLVGVILLFRYGMPYKVRTGGQIGLALEQEDESEKALEIEFDNLGLLGLVAIVIGTVFQVIGAILA